MSSVSQIETCFERLFGERANAHARETSSLKRQREFTGASLAHTFILDPYHSLDQAGQAVRKEALSFLKAFHRDGELRSTLEWLHQVMQSGCRTSTHEARGVRLTCLSRDATGP